MNKLFSFAFPHFLVFLVFSFRVRLQNTERIKKKERKTCEKRLAGEEEELRATQSAMGRNCVGGCEWKIMRLVRVDGKMRDTQR